LARIRSASGPVAGETGGGGGTDLDPSRSPLGPWRERARGRADQMGAVPGDLSICRAQGVLLQVTDARTVAKVLTLLNGRPARSGPGRSGRADARSKAPDQAHPFRVEVPCPRGPGAYDDVVEDGIDEGTLAVEVEARPLSA
jgi:hypothetical protein